MLTFMIIISFAIPILTSIWVGIDSRRLQISTRSDKSYSWNNGSVAWFFGCLLLWIFVFPVYLFKRAKTLKERGAQSSSSTLISSVGAFLVIAAIFCVVAPFFLPGKRLSVDELRDQIKTSIESTLREKTETRDFRLKSFSLIHLRGNEYKGLASVDISGETTQLTVEVTYDGDRFMWSLK